MLSTGLPSFLKVVFADFVIGGPLWPRNGCWLGLRPKETSSIVVPIYVGIYMHSLSWCIHLDHENVFPLTLKQVPIVLKATLLLFGPLLMLLGHICFHWAHQVVLGVLSRGLTKAPFSYGGTHNTPHRAHTPTHTHTHIA